MIRSRVRLAVTAGRGRCCNRRSGTGRRAARNDSAENEGGAAESLWSAVLAYPDGARIAIGANMLRAKSLGAFVDQTVRVLHAAGFDLADASRAADTLLGLVLGAAVERQSAPTWDAAQAEQARTQFPTTIAGFEACRQQGDDALRSFRYSIDILIHGLVALRQESHSAR
ncbi:hypothetical protein F3087_28990 [Nocardia colli]|uniref:Tetracycline repressor TetR C-terminal domain-containing protein n=1 Tax=Nocardia colli TaxID=2545717 RepID=A0A5N0EAA9_9NOCA|nr:TetR/AcrR family transcriptional regulator C-terminal domain-containing protein [Nocardia colli]KAA8885670.1 hypothetical protein F3087_28990 [Nocardia colli]